ncbi:MAG: hypothetical protein R2867_22125 [Caldilineaceae bacterium]
MKRCARPWRKKRQTILNRCHSDLWADDFQRATTRQPDLYATDILYAPASTRRWSDWWGGVFPLTTKLIGDFNVYNVLCAVTVALVLEVPIATIQQAIADFRVVGRMERMDRGVVLSPLSILPIHRSVWNEPY